MQTLPAAKSAYDQLPRRLKRFVDHYVIGGTAAAAIRKAGYKGRYDFAVAHKWLKRPFLKQAIEEATERHLADVGVRQQTVLRQMHAIASVDPRKVEDANGNAIPLHLLDEQTAAAISAVEIEEVSSNGETGKRYKYKFWDKVKANDRLGQFVKLWDAKSTTVNVDNRSVTLNVDAGSADAIRALADIGRQIAALGTGEVAAAADQNGSLLPAPLRNGEAGHRASVDAGEDSGSTAEP